jgi:diguanylate cyclase (GGDEF)-like protein
MARRLTTHRPAIAWSLSLLFAFKGLICVAAASYPISSGEPVSLIAGAGVVAIGAACAIWLFYSRISVVGYELMAAVGSLTTSWIVAHAVTPGGMMVAAFAYPWVAIYAAHFFPRRVVIAQGLLISVGFGVGLLIDGLPHIGIYWAMVTATAWSICLVLGKLSESLRHQAGTDPLTGLLNRNAFLEAANRERSIADRTGAPLVLAVLDLDDFKRVNDSDGHAAGDRVLASLAHTWQECLRGGDVLARHGGDEFVLLLPASTAATARTTLDRMREAETTIGWSAGISEWLAGEPLDACLARADRYLYAVKESARTTAGEPSERLSTELIG